MAFQSQAKTLDHARAKPIGHDHTKTLGPARAKISSHAGTKTMGPGSSILAGHGPNVAQRRPKTDLTATPQVELW